MSASTRLMLGVTGGAKAGASYLVPEQPSIIVGRSPDCAIAIDDPSLSRRHFELAWDGRTCRLTDLGSRNGVLVNGTRVQQAIVQPGDTIQAGEVTCRLHFARGRLSEVGAAPDVVGAPAPQPQDDAQPLQIFASV